jgi:putative DNA primase/helicase
MPNKTAEMQMDQVFQEKAFAEILERERNNIASAPSGEEDAVLYAAALRAGQYSAAGGYNKADVKMRFTAALVRSNESDKSSFDVDEVFELGWTEGVETPKGLTMSEGNSLTDTIQDLASLTDIEYEKIRKSVARKIGMRVSTLDQEVKRQRQIDSGDEGQAGADKRWTYGLWPEEVSGEDLLDEILSVLQKYVIADNATLYTASVWAILTWLADYATVLPIAMITAPEKACGKTVLLSVMGKLSKKPLQAANITSATAFRVIDRFMPTLLVDEADTFMSEQKQLTGIINSGHTRDSAFVYRTESVDGIRVPVAYSTWCPKAIAGIRLDTLNDTLLSRSILLPMRKKREEETVENFRRADPGHLLALNSKLCRWAKDNAVAFSNMKPDTGFLQNRDADNWEPLLAISELAGERWHEMIKNAIITIYGRGNNTIALPLELLRNIERILAANSATDIPSRLLIERLCHDHTAPWSTYNDGKPMSYRQLSDILSNYGIHPKDIRTTEGARSKGYKAADFAEVFARYLNDESAASASEVQPENDAEVANAVTVEDTCIMAREDKAIIRVV